MLFNVPFATGFGTGLYTPAAFLFATIILTIFSIGYVAMARKMRAAGGFYTFISHGLGRELGLAAGISRRARPTRCSRSRCSAASPTSPPRTSTTGSAGSIPWIAFALLAALLISVLCYFDVELSVKVLGFALIGEIDHPRDLRPASCSAGRQRGRRHPVRVAQHLPAHRSGRGPGGRRRPVPGVLVVGRLRGGAQLRGGVEGPAADRPAGDAHLGHRPRHRLRHHVAGLRLRVPGGDARQGRAEPGRPVLRGHGASTATSGSRRSCRC